jgi:type I restriction enzyme M protein
VPLLDEYDVYEQVMSYWHGTMHDDVFLVMNEGWLDAAKPRKTIEDKDRKLSETTDLVVGAGRGSTKYKMDLIPPALIVAHYFAHEREHVNTLSAAVEESSRAVEEYIEEHAVEDGLLAEAMDDDKTSKVLVAARLRVAKREGSDREEVAALEHVLQLYETEAAGKKVVRAMEAELDKKTFAKYGDLSENDIRSLVLDDKWAATVVSRVSAEVEALTLALVSRIQQLGERYAETVEDLDVALVELETKVVGHLADMGVNR